MFRGYDGAGVDYTEREVLPDFSGINTLSTAIIGGATRGPLTKQRITSAKQLRKLYGDPVEGDWGLWAALKVLNNSNLIWYKRVVSSAKAKGVGSITGGKFQFTTKDYDEYLNGAKVVVSLKPGSSHTEVNLGDEKVTSLVRAGVVEMESADEVIKNVTMGAESSYTLGLEDGTTDIAEVVSVKKGATEYVEGTDFEVDYHTSVLTWKDGGSKPSADEVFTATYRCKTVTVVDGDQITLATGEAVSSIKKLFATVTVGAETVTYEYTEGTDFTVDYATGVVTWIDRGASSPVKLPNIAGGAYKVQWVPVVTKSVSELDRYDVTLTKNGTVLEKLTNLTIEPTDTDYIADALDARSDYLTCEPQLGGTVNLEGTYTIAGGNAGIDGLTAADIVGTKGTDEGLQDFKDPEALDISTLIVPGHSEDAVIFGATEVAEARGDIIYIADIPQGLTPQQVDKFSRRKGDWTPTIANGLHQINSKFVAMYYPWVLEYVSDWGKNVYTPPSAWVASQFAYNDTVAQTWFAPAGFQSGTQGRGTLTSALGLEHNCTRDERDIVYADDNGCVNPIVYFPDKGITIWGNKTCLRTSAMASADSSWTQLSVRRLCNYCRKFIIKISMEILFQPNQDTFWGQWRNKLRTELQRIKDGHGIEAFKIQMDETTISEEDKYYGRAPGKVFIKPVHAIEWVPITFTVTHDDVIFADDSVQAE